MEDKVNISARRFLINNSLLTAVISLPAGAFLPYTSAKASILVIDQDISEAIIEGVYFIDLLYRDLKAASLDNSFL